MCSWKKKAKVLFILSGVLSVLFSFAVYAGNDDKTQESEKHRIMVSMGDSYSSGEGVEPFYGQGKAIKEKAVDEDWLAHRSVHSWPGMLSLPGDEGTMADNKGTFWFFVAGSGAKTENFHNTQHREVERVFYKSSYDLPAQLDIFDELEPGSVDYVTMTIGGNDVGFADIIETCVKEFEFINRGKLSDKLNGLWAEFDEPGGTAEKLIDAYAGVSEKAGSQAHIIVAGYPKLLSASQVFISPNEAALINMNVTKFNGALEEIIKKCAAEGMNIYFVPVEAGFAGHEAYSKDPYLNPVIVVPKEEDLRIKVGSDYSMHPNLTGQKVYAACVQAKIDELEEAGTTGIRFDPKDFETDQEKLLKKIRSFINTDFIDRAMNAIEDDNYERASEIWNSGTAEMLKFFNNLSVSNFIGE